MSWKSSRSLEFITRLKALGGEKQRWQHIAKFKIM